MMLVREVADAYEAVDENCRLQIEAMELIRLRVAQLTTLRLRVTQLARVPRSERNSTIADEFSLAVFRLQHARSALSQLAYALRWLRSQQTGQVKAPSLQVAAPAAPDRRWPATHIAAGAN